MKKSELKQNPEMENKQKQNPEMENKQKQNPEAGKHKEKEWDYEFKHNKEWNTSKADINFNFEHPYHSIIMFCRFVRLVVYFIYCMYFVDPATEQLILFRVIILSLIIILILTYIIYKLYKWTKNN